MKSSTATPTQVLDAVPAAARRPVWLNGELIDWEAATLHVVTHATNYGTGVFEGIRFYETSNGPALFRLDAHVDRLQRSLDLFGINCPFSMEEIARGCVEVARGAGANSGYIRPQIQWGVSSRLALGVADAVDAFVFFQPMSRYRGVEGLSARTSALQRLSPAAVPIRAKVIGYYTNSYLNHRHAKELGVDEAVMLDVHGHVAEASSVNVFCVRDGVLFTPEPGFILEGITRASVLDLAADLLGIPTSESVLEPGALHEADEIFFTGTAAEIEPVVRYDDRTIGDGDVGPLTTKIRDAYAKAVRGELPEYRHWLTVAR